MTSRLKNISDVTGYLELISPTFYEQLLLAQIPKAQIDSGDSIVFLCFWDQVSISSTFYVQILRTNVVSAAFSMYM